MIPGGPDPFGDGTEEPEGAGDGDPSAGGTPGGWIPPADRAWRHPSELGSTDRSRLSDAAGMGVGAVPGAGGVAVARRPVRHRVASLSVLSVAVIAVAAGALLLLNTGEVPSTAQSSIQTAVAGPVTAAAGCCKITAAVAHRSAQAVVSITRPTAPASLVGCGVVVSGAGLVVTTADALGGRRVLRVVTADGRQLSANVVAVDHASDIALLSVPGTLPVARFADDANVNPGFPATTVVMAPTGTGHDVRARWWPASVVSIGTAVPQGTGAGMAAIMATGEGGSLPAVAGQPLLDARGEVIGLLDRSGDPVAGGQRTYLPATLVVGVAKELAMNGKVEHGWLGLEGQDATVPATATGSSTAPTLAAEPTVHGAEVVVVEPSGPAAGVLQAGDVIVAVDGEPVRSMAELRDRLYVLPPGSRTVITADRDGQSLTEVVDLSPSP